ncbi:LPS export ABC transporter permease LptG [Arhodomonas sp. AD133]|uniref:LPS export ABC transporter permease LptG n=1 Tax=Arhodomonas sp. AD133 TaxID=3415009 RepID=UPI003EB8C5BD
MTLRLTRYIARQVAIGALMALLVLMALDVVFEFIDQTGDVGQGSYTMGTALVYVLLQTPGRAYEIFPVANLVGALVALGALAGRSELTAMRAAGMSVNAIARAVVLAGVGLAVVAVGLGEWLAPHAARMAQDLRAHSVSEGAAGASEGALWLRDGERYIHVGRVREEAVIEEVSVYTLAAGELERVLEAERGRYDGTEWRLSEVEVTDFSDDGVVVRHADERRLRADLSPELLGLLALSPEMLPLPELARYIDYLERNALETARYRLAFWVKLATPLATVVMVLLTVPLVFRSQRRAGAGQQIVLGVLVGVAFMLLNRLLNNAGVIYGLPPALSALAPPLLFLVAGIVGLSRVR